MRTRNTTSRQRFREFLRAYRAGTENAASRSTDQEPTPARLTRLGELLRRAWPWLRDHRRSTLVALLLLTISTGLRLVMPATTKLAIDHVFGTIPLPGWLILPPRLLEPTNLLLTLGLIAVTAGILERLTRIAGMWHAERTALHLRLSLRRQLVRHLLRLHLHSLGRWRTGGLAGILREDPAHASRLLLNLAVHSWQAVVQLASGLLLLAVLTPGLLPAALLGMPVLYGLHVLSRRWIRPLYGATQAAQARIDGHATEIFAGIRTVRVSGNARAEERRDLTANHLFARTEMLVWWLHRAVDLGWGIILPSLSAAILVLGGFQVLGGQVTLGDLILLLFLLSLFLDPLGLLVGHVADAQRSLAALDRLFVLLNEPAEAAEPASVLQPLPPAPWHITFHQLCFQYPGAAAPALHSINLLLRAGETVALVGPSGAGKTTLCNLLAGFFSPTAGTIAVNGRGLATLQRDRYRRQIGIVEQDVFLFQGTVTENIAYGRRQADAKAIRQAAILAGADDFIRCLPQGYDTLLGERGHQLSGGQRQRLTLARAFLADPRLLILDEATSHLDGVSEEQIQQGLRRLVQDRTCILVAHRLSTVRLAQRIVVLEAGRIVAEGDHQTLAAAPGFYRRMVESQSGLPAPWLGEAA